MQPLLEAVDLSKRYGATVALRGVTFSLGENIILGLLGPNGSGKSTLMRIVAGQSVPSAGRIYIKGMSPGPQTRILAAGRVLDKHPLP